MASGRVEATPDEQLQALRDTRDRYLARADRIKENTNALTDPQTLAEESNARRIANSYEKSIANSIKRMPVASQARPPKSQLFSLRTWLCIFIGISAIEGAILIGNFSPTVRSVSPSAPSAHRKTDQATLLPSSKLPAKPSPLASLAVPVSEIPNSPIPATKPNITAVRSPKVRPREPAPPVAPPKSKRLLPKLAQIEPRVRFKVSRPGAHGAKPRASEARPHGARTPELTAPSAMSAPIFPAKPITPATATEATAPITVATPPPPAPLSVSATARLEPIMQTHSDPPYPDNARRHGEEGITEMSLAISAQGVVSDCEIAKSSGWQDLDMSACIYVIRHWRWQPPRIYGQPVTAPTKVSIAWGLKSAN